ncbi:hypothetical protein VCRLGP107_660057 [Vibrio crassostreae]|nr:hypothetical protein VCRLGP107_660057 [Vibrio crassostreae]
MFIDRAINPSAINLFIHHLVVFLILCSFGICVFVGVTLTIEHGPFEEKQDLPNGKSRD